MDRRFSVAPMLDWTDRHARYFYRLMSKHTVLYTEMVTTGAILFGQHDHLAYNQQEHPLALQLGGSDSTDMARCALKAQQYDYDEVNINVGCPSDRVQNGRFGACLMAEPQLVAENIRAMREQVQIPVTVKSRIGIDDQDSYPFLVDFIGQCVDAGCDTFIVHARKAWLSGLSPKQNREIPPLDYQRVYQLKRDFPNLHISINGGVTSLEQVQQHLQHVDGVMVGREVYANPSLLKEVDRVIYHDAQAHVIANEAVIEQMMRYIELHIAEGGRPWHVARHMLGLFQGQVGARQWRRYLSENGTKKDADASLLAKAYEFIQRGEAISEF